MKAAGALRRPEASADDLQPPIGRGTLPSLEEELAGIKARLAKLEGTLGTERAERPSVDDWLYSSESVAEYKNAIRRLAIFSDMKPLYLYTKKTGGRVPRLADSE
jgi:hypothetical protein